MEEYGFVRENSESDEELANKLWNSFNLQSQDGVSIDSIKNIIAAIMNIIPDPFQVIDSNNTSIKPIIGTYINSILYFDSKQSVKLHEDFKAFYLNKISNKQIVQKSEVHSFIPKLCEGTMKIIKSKKVSAENIISTQRIKTIPELDKECTFKPKLTEYKHTITNGFNR